MSSNQNEIHDEPKLFWFSKLLAVGRLPVFKEIGLLISLIFIKVAPEIPVSLKNSYTGPDGKRAGIIGFVITLFFSFFVNAICTFLQGTLYGSDPEIIYFLDDWWNLVLYIIVCPSYVGLTCWLVVIVVKGWSEINEYKNTEIAPTHQPRKFKTMKAVVLGMLILSVAFVLTTNYIDDIMILKDRKIHYWFLTEKKHELRALGVYYFLLNFSFLIITLIALTFFMSIYSLIMSVGRALESKKSIGTLQFKILKAKLSAFTEAYIVTKGIIACYIANIWIWADSPLGKGTTENFSISVILLTLIGVFLVSIPRYFVELQWIKLKLKSKDESELSDAHQYEDLRTFKVKNIAHILDYIFIGGFLLYAIQHIIESS